jgi:hypothetical protein
MKAPTTIPRAGTTDITNYRDFLHLGLKHCQQLGGDLWTDFNEHDPGVTILEQLCFALTDLAYRTSFDIKDILASVPGAGTPEHCLYTGDVALTSDPVTATDYKKLLYDRIEGLKNARMRRVEGQAQGIEGLHEVLIETREDKEKPEEHESIRKEAVKWMRWFRNLGEDVHAVRILTIQPIQVQATIRIAADVDPASVLAQVLFAIQNHLVPFPQIDPIDKLMNTEPPDEIWNGPRLIHGALDKKSLKEPRETIHVSEIAKIILQVEGVKQIKGLLVGETGSTLSNTGITVRRGCVPRLDPPIMRPQPSFGINIELEGGFKCLVDSRSVGAKIKKLQIGMRQQIEAQAVSFKMLSYLKVPEGKNRNIKDYVSLQHQFPAVYGLGRNNMAASSLFEGGRSLQLRSDNRRQARIRQLRAFLLFFEQPLADYLAQLSHAADLFSLKEDLPHTYFYQPLACDPDPENLADVLVQHRARPPANTEYYLVYMLDEHNEIVFVTGRLPTEADARERRRQIIESGRFLHNYRISRFASGDVRLTLHNSAGTILAVGQQRYTSVEAARVGAEHSHRYMANPQHARELEQRVRSLRREELGVQVIDHESRVVLAGKPAPNREELERRSGDILASGIELANYKIRPWPRGGFHLQLYNSRGELIADGAEIFLTEIDADAGVKTLVALLRRLGQSGAERERHLRRLPDAGVTGESPLRSYHEGLKHIAHMTDHDYLRRRNRILNHLLARFGESFDDSILERLDLRPFGDKDNFFREMIRWKIEFLRGYLVPDESPMPSLGSGRALGFDYGNREASVSGFERRVALLLGIHGHSEGGTYHQQRAEHSDPGYHYLEKSVWPLEPEHLALEAEPGGSVPPASLERERIASPWVDGEPDLRDLHHHIVYSSADSAVVRQLLSFGGNREHYHVQHVHGEFRILFFPPQGAHATEIHRTHSRNGAESTISDLVRYFQGLRGSVENSYAGERMHVVEHVLLRPYSSGQAGPPVQNSSDVPDDFYSYRVSVILPNWPVRFQSDEFKLYAEQLMFENAPAHLAIHCYWLSLGQMKEFEGLYRQWKTVRCEIEEAEVPDTGKVALLNRSAERLRAMIVKLHQEQPPEGPAKPEAGKV